MAERRLTVHDLSAQEMLVLREEVQRRRKSPVAAWLLWFFLGGVGGHRFYLGRIATGLIQLFTLGGIGIWTLIDLFLMSGMLRRNEEDVRDQVLLEIAAARERAAPTT